MLSAMQPGRKEKKAYVFSALAKRGESIYNA